MILLRLRFRFYSRLCNASALKPKKLSAISPNSPQPRSRFESIVFIFFRRPLDESWYHRNPNPSLAEDGLMEAVPISPLVRLEDARVSELGVLGFMASFPDFRL